MERTTARSFARGTGFVRRRGRVWRSGLIERRGTPTLQTLGGGPPVCSGQLPECRSAAMPANELHGCVLRANGSAPHRQVVSHRRELVTPTMRPAALMPPRAHRATRSGSSPSNRLMSKLSTNPASSHCKSPAGALEECETVDEGDRSDRKTNRCDLQTVGDMHIFLRSNSYGPLALPPFQAGPSDLP